MYIDVFIVKIESLYINGLLNKHNVDCKYRIEQEKQIID